MRIIVDEEKCTGCGICKEECPKGAKIWEVDNKAMATNLRYCHLCTFCASKCPEEAILIMRDTEDETKKQDTEEDL